MEKERGSKKNFQEEHKLGTTAVALNNAIHTYEHILHGRISSSPEMKKAVKSSIIELCTAVLICLKD